MVHSDFPFRRCEAHQCRYPWRVRGNWICLQALCAEGHWKGKKCWKVEESLWATRGHLCFRLLVCENLWRWASYELTFEVYVLQWWFTITCNIELECVAKLKIWRSGFSSGWQIMSRNNRKHFLTYFLCQRFTSHSPIWSVAIISKLKAIVQGYCFVSSIKAFLSKKSCPRPLAISRIPGESTAADAQSIARCWILNDK